MTQEKLQRTFSKVLLKWLKIKFQSVVKLQSGEENANKILNSENIL